MRIKRLICAICALLLLSAITLPSFAEEEGVLLSGVAYSEISKEVEEFVEENKDTTAGVSVAVFDRDSSVYEGYFGYANREDDIAVDAQTVMEWGSVTKLTVWVSVMQLVEQGKIDLNEDIQVYLPEGFLKNLRYEKAITMLDLMNHTAGFEELVFGLNADSEESILSLEEALSRYQPVQRFEPGVVQAYSNFGAALAGYIVECVSGQPYYAYVKEHIFEPLGMQHTAILPDLSDNPWVQMQRKQLHCYRADCSYISNGREYVNLYPCGMCTSTLEDLMKFGQALLNPDSPLFDQSSTYEELFTPSAYCGDTDVPSCCHGFWTIYGRSSLFYHAGNSKGCSSALFLELKTGTGIAIMTNQQNETAYNYDLPWQVFYGPLDSSVEVPENPYTGFAEFSRSIWAGPLKLYRLINTMSLTDFPNFITETDSYGMLRYSYEGGDLLPVGQTTVIVMYASVILWVLAAVFSLILLLIRLVKRLLRKKKSPLGAWGTCSCLVQLPFPLLLLPLAQSLMMLEWWPMWCYKLIFIGACVLCLAMAVLFVRGLLRKSKEALTGKQKILRVILLLNLLIAIWNILYWNLFMFWKI